MSKQLKRGSKVRMSEHYMKWNLSHQSWESFLTGGVLTPEHERSYDELTQLTLMAALGARVYGVLTTDLTDMGTYAVLWQCPGVKFMFFEYCEPKDLEAL